MLQIRLERVIFNINLTFGVQNANFGYFQLPDTPYLHPTNTVLTPTYLR